MTDSWRQAAPGKQGLDVFDAEALIGEHQSFLREFRETDRGSPCEPVLPADDGVRFQGGDRAPLEAGFETKIVTDGEIDTGAVQILAQRVEVADTDPGTYEVLEWAMAPGDAVAFNFKTLHGARGNHARTRRRAFSLRLVGDDARYVTRPGRTSPPFPGHGMTEGQRLRQDWFPIIHTA